MDRFNAETIYELGEAMQALTSLAPNARRGRLFQPAFAACNSLDRLANLSQLTFSAGFVAKAKAFMDFSDKLLNANVDKGEVLDDNDQKWQSSIQRLQSMARELVTLFKSECIGLNLYSVEAVLAYDTETLIEQGHQLIPTSLRSGLPEMVKTDLQAAGRCLAFALPTACAFHMSRAAEGVLSLWFEKYIGPKPPKKSDQTFGSLVGRAEREAAPLHKPSASLLSNLKHIKDDYRNPITHPEVEVTVEESHKLVPLYCGVIIDMLDEIAKV